MSYNHDKWRLFLENTGRDLYIFDFDHTVADTSARVVDKETGQRITQAEFDKREHSSDYDPSRYDFEEFDQVIDPKIIRPIVKKLRRMQKQGHKVVILTARGTAEPVKLYLSRDLGIPGVPVIAVNDPNFETEENYSNSKKMGWIRNQIRSGFTNVHFFDDSQKNIDAVKTLRDEFPGVNLRLYLVDSHKRTEPITYLEEMEVHSKYQDNAKRRHKFWKRDIIGRGNQKPGLPFTGKPSMKRSKSAPVGAGGS